MSNHTWTLQDDLMILFVYKFGAESCPISKQQIADKIGVSLGSVSYRIGNFKAIDGIGKATNYAKLSKKVHTDYSEFSMAELKQQAFGC